MARWRPMFRDSRLHVMKEKCDTCIFRPGNRMHLREGRVKDMVETSVARGGAITCHKTIEGAGTNMDGAVCRGFWDGYRDRVQDLQVIERLGLVVEVEVKS